MFEKLAEGVWLGSMLPTGDVLEEVNRAAVNHARHVYKEGRGPGSIEPEESAGLDYHVLTGDAVRDMCPGLWDFYRNGPLLGAVAEATGGPVEYDWNVPSAVNVNVLRPPGRRYEWHTDSQPYTVMWYLTEGDGGELALTIGGRGGEAGMALDKPDAPILTIPPRVGRLVLFDGSKVPHAVMPLIGAWTRISVPMVFTPPGMASREQGTSEYLYSAEEVKAAAGRL